MRMRSVLAQAWLIYTREHPAFVRDQSILRRALYRAVRPRERRPRESDAVPRHFTGTDTDTDTATDTSTLTPPHRHEALLDEVEVMIRVLGAPEALRLSASSDDPGARPRTPLDLRRGLEVVTYLALRESAVDSVDLAAALGLTGADGMYTLDVAVNAARAVLGEDLLPRTGTGRYELSDRVVTDYRVFSELVALADESDDTRLSAPVLRRALDLVQGEPLSGEAHSFAWADRLRSTMAADVAEAAEELAEIRMATGDWRAAEWAARKGLRAAPADERLYRILMRTARAAGNIPGVQRVYSELADLGGPQPATTALFERLTRSLSGSGEPVEHRDTET